MFYALVEIVIRMRNPATAGIDDNVALTDFILTANVVSTWKDNNQAGREDA